MRFLETLLKLMDLPMKTPSLFGWFHWLCLGLTVLSTVLLCRGHKQDSPQRVRSVVLTTSVIVIILEVYKQINYSFSYGSGIDFDYQWYAFPFQFCSTPMYVGLAAGLVKKGWLRDVLYDYLATFSVFAGLCVMLYPGDVFCDTLGINIQTMICHGSMVVIGIYLIYTGEAKLQHKTVLKAAGVFACAVTLAVVLNEMAYFSGILKTETFNMFFISRHCAPSLPVYSSVQAVVPYPWSLLIYVAVFTLAADLVLLSAMGIQKIAHHKEKVPVLH